MNFLPSSSSLCFAAACSLLLSSTPAAEASDDTDELRIATHRDLNFALRAFLENDDRKSREKTFEKLVLEVGASLRGQLFEPQPEWVRCETRKVALESVRRHPDFLNFMQTFAFEAPPHYDDLRLLSLEVLADNCTPAILHEMLRTVDAIGPDSVTYPSLLPPLGRAITNALASLGPAGDAPGTASAFEHAHWILETALDSDKAAQRGGAISGMVEAGRLEVARDALTRELAETRESDLLQLLVRCRRSLLRDDFGPGFREQTLQRARAHAANFLEKGPRGPIGGITGLSPQVLRFREAYKLVRVLGGPEDLPMLLGAFTRDGAASLLGLDGVQRTRLWFQYRRDELDEAQRTEVDNALAAILLNTGERLFEAEESPLDAEERGTYLDARDIRYNCAGYFIGLWEDEESIRKLWCDNPDAVDFLELLAMSTKEEHEGPPEDRLYTAMRDKRETLVQVSCLLAHLCMSTDAKPSEMDLRAFFLTTACREMSVEPQEYLAAMEQWRTTDSTRVCLLITEERPPADDFIKNVALHGLEILGYETTILQSGDAIVERIAD